MAIYDLNGEYIQPHGDRKTFLHRGLTTNATQNQRSAFVDAYHHGFTMVEIDIAITSDGGFALTHDSVSGYTMAQWKALDPDENLSYEDFLALNKWLDLTFIVDGKSNAGTYKQEIYDLTVKYAQLDKAIWGGSLYVVRSIDPDVKNLSWNIPNPISGSGYTHLGISYTDASLTQEKADEIVSNGIILIVTGTNTVEKALTYPQASYYLTDNISVEKMIDEYLDL